MAFFKNADFLFQVELFLRLIIAAFCGALIGYERTNRGKEAGIRTHTIVTIASCLMMIISQYGFEDFFTNFNVPGVDMRLDPSRIAAQIVSGIGFLGAGMIFIQKNVVTGLTTAAGIWAVAGIGMAIGSGMYALGIICTVIIVILQMLLHKSSKFTGSHAESQITVVLSDNSDEIDAFLSELNDNDMTIMGINYKKQEEDKIEITLTVAHEKLVDKVDFMKKMLENKSIYSVKI